MKELKVTFRLGTIVATRGLAVWLVENEARAVWAQTILERYALQDWGDLHEEDKAANTWALQHDTRILANYAIPEELIGDAPDDHVWIITEADRSATTFLFPGEY